MTDRISKIILRGDISGLKASMTAASASVNDVAKRMTALNKEGAAYRQNLTALGTTAGTFGLVAAAGIGLAVRAFANFDEAMSAVAATGDDARGSLDALREAAIEAGARTKYSATEAAQAIENMAKAGVSAADILGGGLDGALDLAAAGGLDVAQAAEIAATSMNQFKLVGEDIPHIADLLAAAAGKAMGDVADMGLAFTYVGTSAAQMGISMEEAAGTIALLAQNGILGEKAGTSLRGMLTSLTSPSAKAADTMKRLGINLYDAEGHFIGFSGVAEELKQKLAGLSEAQQNVAFGDIFGTEQVSAARILYDGGAEAVRNWTAAVDDQGYAAETAAIKMDNLKGDLEQLGGALETALIGTGEGANGPLREMVQLLSTLVDGYNALPGPIKTLILAGGGLTAAIGGTAFVATRAISAYSDLKGNLAGVGASFDKVNKKALAIRGGVGLAGVALAGLSGPAHEASETLGTLTDIASTTAIGFAAGGPWGAAAGFAIGTFSALTSGGADTEAAMANLTATLDSQTGAITENTAQWIAKGLASGGAADALASLGISLADATDAALGNEEAMKRVKAATEDAGLVGEAVRKGIEGQRDAILAGKEANIAATEAVEGSTEATAALGVAATDAATEVKELSDSLDSLLDPLLSQDAAMVEWKRSIQSLTADLVKNGGGLDSNTKQGQDNRDAIRDRVSALKDSAQADLAATGNQEKFTKKLQRGAKQILEAGTAAGIGTKEMKGYLKQLGLTPAEIKTLIQADDKATPKIKDVKDGLNDLDGKTAKPSVYITGVNAVIEQINRMNAAMRKSGGKVHYSAGYGGGQTIGGYTGMRIPEGYVLGGRVPGRAPADPTVDNVLAMGATGRLLKVRSGEWIINEQQSKKNDPWLAAINAGLNIDDLITGYASGGKASTLDIKSQQRTVRDIERSLKEREKYGKKPKKGKDARPTRYVLRGLDRQIARLELEEAKQELRDLRSGAAARQDRLDDATGTRDSVASGLAGGYSLADQIVKNPLGIYRPISGSTIAAGAKAYAAKLKAFAAKIEKARKLGIPATMLQEVAGLGVEEGTIALDALLSSSSSEIADIKASYRDINAYSKGAGEVIAKALDLTEAGKDSATGYAKGFIASIGGFGPAMQAAANTAAGGKKPKSKSSVATASAGYSRPTQSQPIAWPTAMAPAATAAPQTTSVSLVGVEVAIGTDGIARIVQGQIQVQQNAQAIESRFA